MAHAFEKVVDEMALNEAVHATVVQQGSYKFLRLVPHSPGNYYATQKGSIVLSSAAIEGLHELLVRNGLLPSGR